MKNISYWSLINMVFFLVASSVCASESNTLTKPFIGTVRILLDEQGQSTAFVVPVIPDETVQKQVTQQQVWKQPHMEHYFALLRTESDPNARRHLLFELGFATGEMAYKITEQLFTMFANEPDEQVRMAYIACFASLATQAGLPDSQILQIITAIQGRLTDDPSWNVKVQAAEMLVWFGDNHGETILQDVIAKNQPLDPVIWDSMPVTLQRMNTKTAQALLIHLGTQSPNDTVKLNALWGAYQLGITAQADVLRDIEGIARTSTDRQAKIRAVSTLNSLARENPLLQEQICTTIQEIYEHEQDSAVKQQLFMLEQQRKEGQYDCQ
ncbi:hypothetical protein U27_04721 [Candidatus Vecturithrix granuli]|uniref:HEAT repeat domain-containing protein n=1 Tax=Vecturithrix granuli TaxID=1499967 RepID=A0A081BZJ9_VECG1|nr:hypothetical protein U27_04721 [Candidatus Vecturithrix granuli]